ncbi:MAG: PQQ-binding-like beta-propeller repeat protein [Candidatus Nanoarchaeia archaeon]
MVKISTIVVLMFFFVFGSISAIVAQEYTSEGNESEWLMQGRNLNHSGWDGVEFFQIEELHIATFNTSEGYSFASPIVAQGFAYVGSNNGIIYQFNASNVTQIVEYYDSSSAFFSSPIVVQDFLYIGSEEGKVYQLNATNISQKIAEYSMSGTILSAPILWNNFIFIGGWEGQLYQLNATNISQKIAGYELSSEICASPAVAGDFLYVEDLSGIIYQLNVSNISQLIASYESGVGGMCSSPAVAYGFVYVGSDDGFVYQLDAVNISQVIDYYETGGAVLSSPAVAYGFVYVGSDDGFVYQLDATNISQLHFRYDTQSGVSSSPAVTENYVYIGGSNSYFYQLSASNISLENPDYEPPTIQFNFPSEQNNITIHREDIFVNVSALDNKDIANITIYVYNSEDSVIFQKSFSESPAYSPIYNLDNGVYYVNASACDLSNNCAISETIYVMIDVANDTQVMMDGWRKWRKNNQNNGWDGGSFDYVSGMMNAKFVSGAIIASSPAVAYGFVYVGSNDGFLYQLNATNVSYMISKYFTGSISYSSPAVLDGFVYVGSDNGTIYQLNATNVSDLISIFVTEGDVYSSPVVAEGFVYIGSDDHKIYKLNATNISQMLESHDLGAEVKSSLAVVDGFVYVGIENGHMMQLNATNISQQIAEYVTTNSILSSPIIAKGYLYLASEEGIVYQLDATNISRVISQYVIGSDMGSSPAVVDGYLYVGAGNGILYQLNATDVSQLISSYEIGESIYSSPAVAGGYVYVGSDDGYIYQLDALDINQIISSYATSGGVLSSPAVAGGYVYVGSNDGRLYQLRAIDISLENSDFVMPYIDFENPSTLSGATILTGTIIMNVSANCTNLENLSIFLYYESYNESRELLDVVSSQECQLYHAFSGLELGKYYFNATTCSMWGDCESTETRTATLIEEAESDSRRTKSASNVCGTWSSCVDGKQIRYCTITGVNEKSCGIVIVAKEEDLELVLPSIADGEFVSNKEQLQIPTQLFDIDLNLLEKSIYSGENLSAVISLINLGVPGRVNATLYYEIKDETDKIVYSETEIVVVATQEEFIKNINTANLELGEYRIHVDLTYEGQNEPANSQGVFIINKQKYTPLNIKDLVLPIEILFLLFTLVFTARWYTKNIKNKKR